jgi:hypothetical protein
MNKKGSPISMTEATSGSIEKNSESFLTDLEIQENIPIILGLLVNQEIEKLSQITTRTKNIFHDNLSAIISSVRDLQSKTRKEIINRIISIIDWQKKSDAKQLTQPYLEKTITTVFTNWVAEKKPGMLFAAYQHYMKKLNIKDIISTPGFFKNEAQKSMKQKTSALRFEKILELDLQNLLISNKPCWIFNTEINQPCLVTGITGYCHLQIQNENLNKKYNYKIPPFEFRELTADELERIKNKQ